MTPSEAIDSLRTADWSEVAIAAELRANGVQTTQSTVNRIRHGMQPSYEVGKALIDLAERVQAERRAGAANDGGAAQADGTQVRPLKAA